jgi:hypothetical protein
MKNLDRRIERLEEMLETKAEPRVMVTTNVTPSGGEETPSCVKFALEQWAIAIRGGPFTDKEIRELREEYYGSGYGQS